MLKWSKIGSQACLLSIFAICLVNAIIVQIMGPIEIVISEKFKQSYHPDSNIFLLNLKKNSIDVTQVIYDYASLLELELMSVAFLKSLQLTMRGYSKMWQRQIYGMIKSINRNKSLNQELDLMLKFCLEEEERLAQNATSKTGPLVFSLFNDLREAGTAAIRIIASQSLPLLWSGESNSFSENSVCESETINSSAVRRKNESKSNSAKPKILTKKKHPRSMSAPGRLIVNPDDGGKKKRRIYEDSSDSDEINHLHHKDSICKSIKNAPRARSLSIYEKGLRVQEITSKEDNPDDLNSNFEAVDPKSKGSQTLKDSAASFSISERSLNASFDRPIVENLSEEVELMDDTLVFSTQNHRRGENNNKTPDLGTLEKLESECTGYLPDIINPLETGHGPQNEDKFYTSNEMPGMEMSLKRRKSSFPDLDPIIPGGIDPTTDVNSKKTSEPILGSIESFDLKQNQSPVYTDSKVDCSLT